MEKYIKKYHLKDPQQYEDERVLAQQNAGGEAYGA